MTAAESHSPELRYTDEQAAALSSSERLVALEAGAGCGKTFVLTERLLAELDPTAVGSASTVDEVVAITFTDAAAREMRDRVRSKCFDRLNATIGESRDAWLRLLRTLDTARVSTIHSFCGQLLRTHAVDLGLDPSFTVLDQATADVMLSEAIDARLRAGLEGQHESTLNLAADYGIEGLKKNLLSMLGDSDANRQAWLEQSPLEIVDVWRRVCQRLVNEALAQLRDGPELGEIERLLNTLASEPTEKFAARRTALLDLVPRLREGDDSRETIDGIIAACNLQGVVARYWSTPGEVARYKQVAAHVRDELKTLPVLAADDKLHRAADLGLAVLREAQGVAEEYIAMKRAAGGLDFEDELRETHRLLTEPAFADAQQAIRRGVRLLLVDEFQDTDHLQADLVRALVGLSRDETDSADDGGRLFFVGDFKQSIYRFRGAEPAVFRGLQEQTPASARLPLSTNFRSQPAVLSFVNHLFAPGFGDRYTPLAAKRPQVVDEPAVELLVTPPPGDKASAEQKRAAEARAIARRVRELIDSQAPIAAGDDGARPVRPGDIAMLFQSLSNIQHYEKALREQGIEYYLVGGHAFYSQQEVYDILHLLRVVASGCDEVALAGVLRSPMFAIEDETLYWMVQQSRSLAGAIASRHTPAELSPAEGAKLTRARETLAVLRAMKGRATTAEILREAIERTGYDAALLVDFLGERKLANLGKLIEQARASDAAAPAGAGDLDRFLKQLSEFTLRGEREALASTTSEDADVVRLMTIHQSKGLEFPVVIVPDLHRKSRNDSDSAALDAELGPLVKPTSTDKDAGFYGLDLLKQREKPEEQAEALRKFYVACTRAADYLMLSAVTDPAGKLEGEALNTLAERYDLTTGESIDDGPTMRVTAGDGSTAPQAGGGRRPDRLRRINEVRQHQGAPTHESPRIAPVPIRSESLRQFSVSRLTGKLHQGRERPPGVALAGALQSDRKKIDPLGFGTLVHAVLERLPLDQLPSDTLIDTLAHELAPLHLRRQINLGSELAAELVNRFVASDPWRMLTSAARFEREVEFLLAWPPRDKQPATPPADAWLRGYIDALAQDHEGRWWIIDFKTNHTEAAGVAKLAEEYRLQLGVYALAVEQARGVKPAGMRLCFLRPGVTVDFEWNDVARQNTTRLVNQAIANVRAEVITEPA